MKQHDENNFNKQHQKCVKKLNAIMSMFKESKDSNFGKLIICNHKEVIAL
jgi:hypothetical protein